MIVAVSVQGNLMKMSKDANLEVLALFSGNLLFFWKIYGTYCHLTLILDIWTFGPSYRNAIFEDFLVVLIIPA